MEAYHLELTSNREYARSCGRNENSGVVHVRNLNRIEKILKKNWRLDFYDLTNSGAGLHSDTHTYIYSSGHGPTARVKAGVNFPMRVHSVDFSGSTQESLESSLREIGIKPKGISFREGNPL